MRKKQNQNQNQDQNQRQKQNQKQNQSQTKIPKPKLFPKSLVNNVYARNRVDLDEVIFGWLFRSNDIKLSYSVPLRWEPKVLMGPWHWFKVKGANKLHLLIYLWVLSFYEVFIFYIYYALLLAFAVHCTTSSRVYWGGLSKLKPVFMGGIFYFVYRLSWGYMLLLVVFFYLFVICRFLRFQLRP